METAGAVSQLLSVVACYVGDLFPSTGLRGDPLSVVVTTSCWEHGKIHLSQRPHCRSVRFSHQFVRRIRVYGARLRGQVFLHVAVDQMVAAPPLIATPFSF